MIHFSKRALTVVMLSSLVAAPAATISVVVAPDAAFAKSDNAGGKGKGKSAQAGGNSQKTNSITTRGRSGAKRKGGSGISTFLEKLTGQDRRSARVAAKYEGGLAPWQLGNMNGALHANENAVLAHIRNGNPNGPVGLMAALAIADHNTAGARAVLDSNLAREYAALDALARDQQFESYQAYLDSGETNELLDVAASNLGKSDFQDALIERDYATYDAYLLEAYGDMTETHPGDPELIDPELEALHDKVGVYDAATAGTFQTAAAEAGEYDGAMENMLAYWNKGSADGADADALREALEARLSEYEHVGETIDMMATEADASEPCPEGEICEDVVVVAE